MHPSAPHEEGPCGRQRTNDERLEPDAGTLLGPRQGRHDLSDGQAASGIGIVPILERPVSRRSPLAPPRVPGSLCGGTETTLVPGDHGRQAGGIMSPGAATDLAGC